MVFDLTIRQPCAEADDGVISGEIVVCAEVDRQSRYRLRDGSGRNGGSPPKAEFEVKSGVALAVETESADLGMVREQRAMVRLKFKF